MEKYTLMRELGSGGTSRVYLGADRQDGKKYAIKRYGNSREFARAQREFTLMGECRHPGIPAVREIVPENEGGSVVMEYVPGVTLRDTIEREGAVREEQARRWGIELCGILAYLHRRERTVIYRDVKPGNIMVTPLSHVKLIDFGAAVVGRNGTAYVKEPVGTSGYAAPEQFERDSEIDIRVDIYGFGATMWHMLTGRRPSGTGLLGVGRCAGNRGQRCLPAGMAEIVSRCVMKDPEQRYRYFEEVKRDLENRWRFRPFCRSVRLLRSELCCAGVAKDGKIT